METRRNQWHRILRDYRFKTIGRATDSVHRLPSYGQKTDLPENQPVPVPDLSMAVTLQRVTLERCDGCQSTRFAVAYKMVGHMISSDPWKLEWRPGLPENCLLP